MKFKFLSLIVLAAFFFTGASPWEGAAVTAPEGELPISGLFVATNSFPRNTVIEIINLENSKSVRAIVANTLDSPGILAIVSRQAAELIGMRQGSVSRIRILQPSEPVAYSRFADNAAAGVADFDSGNVITEENYFEEPLPPEENTYTAEETLDENESISDAIAAVTTAKGDTAREIPEELTMTGAPILLEPEWSVEDSAIEESSSDIERLAEENAPVEEAAVTTAEEIEPLGEHLAEAEPEETEVIIIEEEVFEPEAELTEESELTEETDIVAEIIIEEDNLEPEAELAAEYEMIPAEERPPENVYDLPTDFLEGIGGVAAAVETKPEPSALSPIFSVQSVPQLSGGQFYVQLAAVPAAESETDIVRRVENAVSRIPPEYKPFAYVYKDDNWYRILLGAPLLNEGESAAMLQRVRSIGFKDAFVQSPETVSRLR